MLDIFDGLDTIEFGLSQGEEYKTLDSLRIQNRVVDAPDLLGTIRSLNKRNGKVKSFTEGLETTQLGLEQGQEYKVVDSLRIENRLANAPDLLQTKDSDDENIIEGLADTISPEIKELKKNLTKKLAEYTAAHKLLMEESINNTAEQKKTIPYYDKTITIDGKKYSYINNYGYKHEYATDAAWESRNTRCIGTKAPCPDDCTTCKSGSNILIPTGGEELTNGKCLDYCFNGYCGKGQNYSTSGTDCKNCGKDDNVITVTKEIYDSVGKLSNPMNDGQPCKIAGTVIKNNVSNEMAWVDVEGVKHVFSSDIWTSRHKTCSDIIDALDLTPTDYASIPLGTPMKETDVCKRTYVSLTLEKKLDTLDTELKILAQQLDDKITGVNHSNNNAKHAITTETQKWNRMKDNMNKNYSSITNRENADITLQAKDESSGLFAISNQMHFYVWLVFVILLLCYVVKVVYERTTSIYDPNTLTLFNWQNIIVFASCIWILSTVWKFRPNWMRAEWYTIPAWLR